jgi:hypothetical protein
MVRRDSKGSAGIASEPSGIIVFVASMNEPNFNLHAARRLEDIRFAAILEDAANQRETDLNALQGITNSGGRRKREMDIIFASTEAVLEKFVACRKELAKEAPALLLEFPYLKELHDKLDQCIDGAILTLRARQHVNGLLLALRTRQPEQPGAGNAVMRASTLRANALKKKMNREIKELALEGTLSMHRREEPTVTNIHNITVQAGSLVGAINTGQVERIDVAIDHIKLGGDTALAQSLAQFTEGLLADAQLHENDKKEILEQLSFLSNQTAPEAPRIPGMMMRSALEGITKAVTTPALTALCITYTRCSLMPLG